LCIYEFTVVDDGWFYTIVYIEKTLITQKSLFNT